MEVASSSDRPATVFVYEGIGTMLFVYSIMLTNNPISIAFSLFASIVIFGAITGGHFNPAVTLGVYISEGKWKENASWLVSIIVAQVLGAFVAQGLATLTLFEDTLSNIPAANVPKLCPQDPTNADWATSPAGNEISGTRNEAARSARIRMLIVAARAQPKEPEGADRRKCCGVATFRERPLITIGSIRFDDRWASSRGI